MSNDYLLDKRILLVDDEQELLDMVHSILDEYGFHHINTATVTIDHSKYGGFKVALMLPQ